MKLTAEREKLLAPLQAVIGVVERRQTMPVLANVLLGVRQGQLSITATDLGGRTGGVHRGGGAGAGDITVPGRKFLDILRALPEKAAVSLTSKAKRSSSRRAQPLQSVDAAGRGISGDRRHQFAANGADAAQGIAAFAGENAFFDGAARRSLLFERHAAGDRWPGAACGGHRRTSLWRCAKTGLGGEGEDLAAGHRAAQRRVGTAARADRRGTASWRSEPIMFAPRSAMFASHRS
jgi:hypothetical protein